MISENDMIEENINDKLSWIKLKEMTKKHIALNRFKEAKGDENGK